MITSRRAFGNDRFALKAEAFARFLQRNTVLTEFTQKLTERVKTLAVELHEKLLQKDSKP